MGTKRQPKKRTDIFKRRSSENGSSTADWANAEPQFIQDLICKIAKHGGAVRFGYTRDGGAYSIGLYLGDDRTTEYVRPYEDIDVVLRDLADSLDDYSGNAPAQEPAF